MSVAIRPAEVTDTDALVGLEKMFPTDRLSRHNLRRLITKAHADVFVAEKDDTVVGDAIVLYRRGFQSARLYSLVVNPDLRGAGIGSALLSEVEKAALAAGCVSVRLEVREDNAGAIGLYERLGYVRVGHTADYYEDHSSALRMRKRLTPLPPPTLAQVPYYPQSLDFTCGPAALMMALRYLGLPEPMSRGLELQLWREATTVFMMSGHGGCSAHGLGLAARRRGFLVVVTSSSADAPFLNTVRKDEKKAVIALSHEQFVAELSELDAELRVAEPGINDVIAALDAGGVPIVLMSGYRLYGEKLPHWLVATGYDDTFLYFHDPYVPDEVMRADSVHLPLARKDFAKCSRFGKEKRRDLLVVYPPKD